MSTARRSSSVRTTNSTAATPPPTTRRNSVGTRVHRYAPPAPAPTDSVSTPAKEPAGAPLEGPELRHDAAHASATKPAAAFVASASRPTLPRNLFNQAASAVAAPPRPTTEAMPGYPAEIAADEISLGTSRVDSLAWLEDLNRAAAGLAQQDAAWEPALEVPGFAWPGAATQLLAVAQQDMAELLLRGDREIGSRRVLFVTSSAPGAGATTVALCLARAALGRGERVVLVDADLTEPTLAAQLGICPQTSWTTALETDLPLGEALVESLQERAILAPLAHPVARPEPLLAHPGLANFWQALVNRFDRVIVDAGSLTRGSQVAGLIGLQVAELLFVQDTRRPAAPELNQALRCFPNLQACRCGIVQNYVRS